jgi:hypothetical protein
VVINIKVMLSKFYKILAGLIIVQFCSCGKFNDINQKPELESLQYGLKTSAAIGYCASAVMAEVDGQVLPGNVTHDNATGLIHIKIDKNHPLPFNTSTGDIIIAYTWSGQAGLMTILFGNIDILGGNSKLYGLHLVPFTKQTNGTGLLAILVKQNIIIGNGSDTLLDMSHIIDFNTRIGQLNSDKPGDVFVAAKQNVWFINIDQNTTVSDIYDDNITINGGGQIAEVKGSSGGVIYHGMIGTIINYSICKSNPVAGFALTQNFKFGGEPYVDLGNSLLSFRNICDGKAHVEISTGKYLTWFDKDIQLNLN